MLKRKQLAIVIGCIAMFGLSSCATTVSEKDIKKLSTSEPYTTKQYKSDPTKSLANNILSSAGIPNIPDAKLSAEEYKKLGQYARPGALGGAINTAWVASSFSGAPISGLAGMGITMLASAGDVDFRKRVNQIAYIPVASPTETREEALRRFHSIQIEASKKALSELGATIYKQENKNWNYFDGFFLTEDLYFSQPRWGCKEDNTCVVDIMTTPPIKVPAPDYVDRQGQMYWAFNMLYKKTFKFKQQSNSIIVINEDKNLDVAIPQLKVYEAIYKHLPEHVYAYMPPEYVSTTGAVKNVKVITGSYKEYDDLIKYPFIISKNSILLFAMPK